MLNIMAGATIFSKIILKSGYHQICVCPEDEWKAALKTKRWSRWIASDAIQFLEYAGYFHARHDAGVETIHWQFLVVYFDDIPSYNSTKERHLNHLWQYSM